MERAEGAAEAATLVARGEGGGRRCAGGSVSSAVAVGQPARFQPEGVLFWKRPSLCGAVGDRRGGREPGGAGGSPACAARASGTINRRRGVTSILRQGGEGRLVQGGSRSVSPRLPRERREGEAELRL